MRKEPSFRQSGPIGQELFQRERECVLILEVKSGACQLCPISAQWLVDPANLSSTNLQSGPGWTQNLSQMRPISLTPSPDPAWALTM